MISDHPGKSFSYILRMRLIYLSFCKYRQMLLANTLLFTPPFLKLPINRDTCSVIQRLHAPTVGAMCVIS